MIAGAGELTEGSKTQYHLYHSNGTRWQDAVWDACDYEDGRLTLTSGQDRFVYAVTDAGMVRQAWYSEHAVGLHTIRMELNAAQLAKLPEDSVLLADNGLLLTETITYLPGTIPDTAHSAPGRMCKTRRRSCN